MVRGAIGTNLLGSRAGGDSAPRWIVEGSAVGESTQYVGIRRPRIDARDKVTGATRYAADLTRSGLLHARIVPAVYAHARIRSVDAAAALVLPGVIAVLTARDLPIAGQGEQRRFEPLARDEVVFAGQPVALVIGETEAAAEDGAGLVKVELETLEPVVDVLAAVEPNAPLARTLQTPDVDQSADNTGSEAATRSEADPDAVEVSRNVFSRTRERRGDVDSAFARCAVIVEGRFRSSWAHQAYLEPHVATSWIEADGTLAVTSSTQALFYTRNELAKIFGLPPAKVRVSGATVGGAFGSKQVVIEPLVAAAALRLRSPVRLVLTRQEDFATTKPAQGMVMDVRIGAGRSGEFEALEARMTYDAGSYAESSWHWFASHLITGPYRWPTFDVLALGVRTNKFPAGNYRAPTGPPGAFALESLVDELAERLGLDPVDVRSANLVVEGDPMADGETWQRFGAQECLERLREHPIWTGRSSLPAGEGVGLAIGVWQGSMEPAAATCRLEPDGTINVITGVADISGAASGFAIIAAETFGIPIEAVTVTCADTSSAPQSPGSSASAITYGAGLAVQKAVADARDRLLRVAANGFEIDPGDLEIVDGIVRPRDTPTVGRTVAEIARDLSEGFDAPVEGHATTAHSVIAPSAAGHLAHVRVDEESGSVELLGYAVVQDAGRALNPALVEGQMLGGTVQSIGLALYEALVHDDHGQLLTGTFLDYAVPRAAALPPIDTLIVEVPAPEGPFGARGIGEASILPGPAAIANAIAAATGIRLRELPMTGPRVWAAGKTRQMSRSDEPASTSRTSSGSSASPAAPRQPPVR
jgi:CO/xanthine dehydrogenase Mo-binding subunit